MKKSHIFCKADPAAVDMHPLCNDPMFRMGLGKLMKAATNSERKICLFCGCLRPCKCHRSRLIGEALVAEFHRDQNGDPVAQAQVMAENAPAQTALS